MTYLGTPPHSGFISQEANQYFTGLTQNYIDLNQSINSLSSVIILVNGVVQENSTLTSFIEPKEPLNCMLALFTPGKGTFLLAES